MGVWHHNLLAGNLMKSCTDHSRMAGNRALRRKTSPMMQGGFPVSQFFFHTLNVGKQFPLPRKNQYHAFFGMRI